ncbi:Transcription factor ABORTED MICROSPORES [Spatholobus suberectus]|nr:Transcription factor ABORTED MICROSPORES [Spatholobus suberectus]
MSDCSDQNEEEEDGKYRRRNGKGNQSKNLVAERKRRRSSMTGELGPNAEHGKAQTGFHVGTSGNAFVSKQKQEDATVIDKQTQQMEPQVEVALIDGNEYFVKVFCEHRPGGFVKLMEVFNTLGMDVVHATVTSHKGLVSNVFKVEKKDSETVEAEDVRDSLLELTRNRYRGWTHEMTATSENDVGRDQHQLHNPQMGAYHPHQFHS